MNPIKYLFLSAIGTSRQIFFIIAVITLLIFLSSGCQALPDLSDFNRATQTPSAASMAVTPPPIPFDATQPAAPLAPLTLTIWIPQPFDPESGTEAGSLLKSQLAAFENEFPEITLDIRVKAVTGKGGLLDTLVTASAAAPGAVPGIILLNRTDFETAAEKGLLTSLEIPSDETIDPDQYPFARELAQVQGTTYGITLGGDALMMVYRPAQVSNPPDTWQDAYVQRLTIVFPASDPRGLFPLSLYLNAGNINFEGEEINLREDALGEMTGILSQGITAGNFPDWLGDFKSYNDTWEYLEDATPAFTVAWTSQVLGGPHTDMMITTLPSNGEPDRTLMDGWIISFPYTQSGQITDRMQLAEYLTAPAFQQVWSEAVGLIPTRISILERWKDTTVSGILMNELISTAAIPPRKFLEKVGPAVSSATIGLIKQQMSQTQAVETILEVLSGES